MPCLISKKNNIPEQNAFYKKCGSDGLIPVICRVRRTKADIDLDAHAIDNDQLRKRLGLEEHLISDVVVKAYEALGAPKCRSWAVGYYSYFLDMDADVAKKFSARLSKDLDMMVTSLH